ncbi:MAG: hypothetical protein ABJA83_10665 [Burkholderiaceae bacterium]
MRKMAENKFAPMAGLPSCATLAVQSGDPAKGASVILLKAKPGCMIPWHWHTPTESVMMVSGSAKLEMKDHPAVVLGPGGYGQLVGKHVHQFTCMSACTAFVSAEGAVDIHYVDVKGNEITPDVALKRK